MIAKQKRNVPIICCRVSFAFPSASFVNGLDKYSETCVSFVPIISASFLHCIRSYRDVSLSTFSCTKCWSDHPRSRCRLRLPSPSWPFFQLTIFPRSLKWLNNNATASLNMCALLQVAIHSPDSHTSYVSISAFFCRKRRTDRSALPPPSSSAEALRGLSSNSRSSSDLSNGKNKKSSKRGSSVSASKKKRGKDHIARTRHSRQNSDLGDTSLSRTSSLNNVHVDRMPPLSPPSNSSSSSRAHSRSISRDKSGSERLDAYGSLTKTSRSNPPSLPRHEAFSPPRRSQPSSPRDMSSGSSTPGGNVKNLPNSSSSKKQRIQGLSARVRSHSRTKSHMQLGSSSFSLGDVSARTRPKHTHVNKVFSGVHPPPPHGHHRRKKSSLSRERKSGRAAPMPPHPSGTSSSRGTGSGTADPTSEYLAPSGGGRRERQSSRELLRETQRASTETVSGSPQNTSRVSRPRNTSDTTLQASHHRRYRSHGGGGSSNSPSNSSRKVRSVCLRVKV